MKKTDNKKVVDYIKYFKDNPKGYWFKRRLYGWGWVPVRWQGWLFLLIWIGLYADIILIFNRLEKNTTNLFIGLIIPLILQIAILFFVCYGTGEKPRWSWGK